MALLFGCDVYVDGILIDCETWGNLRVSVGPFAPLRQGSPHRATIDFYDTWDGATFANGSELTIVVTGPDVGTAPSGTYDDGAGEWSWIMFHGLITQKRGQGANLHLGQRVIRCDALGMEALYLNQNVTLSAAANGTLRDAVFDVGTATSGTTEGYDQFPDSSWPQVDRPAFTRTKAGQVLAVAGASVGTWVTCEWDATGAGNPFPLTAGVFSGFPDIIWRPSHFLGGTVASTYAQPFDVHQAWVADFREVGISWSAGTGSVRVNGETAGGTATTGTANTANPAYAGSRVTNVTTWIDSDAGCAAAATELAGRSDPAWIIIGSVVIHPESYVDLITGLDNDGAAYTATTAQAAAWEWIRARPGDPCNWYLPTGEGAVWPTGYDALEDEMLAVFSATENAQEVTGAVWEWHPTLGWVCGKSMMPNG